MATTTTDAEGNTINVFDRSDVGPRSTGPLTDAEKDEIVTKWNTEAAAMPAREAALVLEEKITAEGKAIIRQLAIDALTDRGEI